jgi:predicted RNase H-like HicB family nuclease
MPKAAVLARISVQILREGRYFIASCPALDIATQATSYEKVQHRFGELVDIFLEEMVRAGKLEKYLTDLGWVKHIRPEPRWEPPNEIVSNDYREIRIPCHA